MIVGFVRKGDGTTATLNSAEEAPQVWAQPDGAVWVDLESPSEQEVQAIGSLFRLDPSAIEDCLYGEQRPRIDEFQDHIFLVLYGAVGVDDSTMFDPRKLAVFCGERFLVTVHREPLLTLRNARKRCAQNVAHTLGKGVDFVLFGIIDAMADRYIKVAEGYEHRLLKLEEDSLDGRVDESMLSELSILRQELLNLKQVAASQKALLLPISNGEYDYISATLEQRFKHVSDHLAQVMELIDRHRELLHVIRDNYHTAMANRTNTLMSRLTVLATIMLPLTLIAGIYGMNVPLWPSTDAAWGFWAILGVMLLIAGAGLLYFKNKKWL